MAGEDLERWDARYRAGEHASAEPSSWLVALADRLPRQGRALDVAGGAGRNALWLARRGLDVTLCDISEVALGIARERAAALGLGLATVAVDLEAEPLPSGPWELVFCAGYLQRSLFGAFARELGPGGALVYAHPTVQNLERHARPPRRFLLDEGELAELARGAGFTIDDYREEWTDEGRHLALLLARRPAAVVAGAARLV